MKRTITIIAVFLALGFLASIASAKDESAGSTKSSALKLGYIDLNRALNEVEEGRSAKAKLEADGKAKKQKLEILQNELKKMKEDLDKQRLILSAEALREKETVFQQKFLELQRTTLEYEKDFAQKEADYIKPISEKLQRVIQNLGQDEGYTLIVPREMALYSPPGTDLTDKIIAAYNKAK